MVSADIGAMGAPIPADSVRMYLAQLEAAMTGQDRAVVHDALVDAEAHLRAAIAAGASPDRAIGEFGTPDEIARAYVEAIQGPRVWTMSPSAALLGSGASGASSQGGSDAAGAGYGSGSPESTASSSTSATPRGGAGTVGAAGGGGGVGSGGNASGYGNAGHGGIPASAPILLPVEPALDRLKRIPILGIWFNRYAWGGLLYFGAVGFILSLAYFVWVVVLGSLSIGTAVILVGLFLMVLLLGSVRAICLFEGMVVETLLGVRMPRRTQPVYTTAGIGFWQRIGCWLSDIRSWLSLAYLLGNFPVSAVLFAAFVGLCSASAMLVGAPVLSLLGLPVAQFHSSRAPDFHFVFLGQPLVPDASGDVYLPIGTALFALACGLVLFTGTLWLARGIGWIYGHVVQAIQVARPQAVLVPPGAAAAARGEQPRDPPIAR